MKIYYVTTTGLSDKQVENIATDDIPAMITAQGHDVFIYTYDPTNPGEEASFNALLGAILDADAFIGEMSRSSQTLGFQLASALNASKPSLYLYNSSRNGKPDTSLSNNPSRLLRISSYGSKDEAQSVLNSFLKFADQQTRSTRTSFISTKRIDNYITQESTRLGISKGEAIRQLLNDAINRKEQ